MNDCFWNYVDVCSCEERCEKYLNINSWECEEIEKKYTEDVEEALRPIKEKYRRKLKNKEDNEC